MSEHPAVMHALDIGEYTDGYDQQWLRREDGWWDTPSPAPLGTSATEATMVTIIEGENR